MPEKPIPLSTDQNSLSVPTGAPVATVRPSRWHIPALMGFGFLLGATLVQGQLWWSALGAVGLLATLFRMAKTKTAQHEKKLSLPPALAAVKERLGSLSLEPALHALSVRTQGQLQLLEHGLKMAAETLQTKLDPNELAFARFHGGLENAAAAVFAVLQDVVGLLNQAELVGANTAAAIDSQTQAAKALDQNEQALQVFQKALAALSSLDTDSHRVTLPEAIHDLEQIAARAKNLSLKQGDSNG